MATQRGSVKAATTKKKPASAKVASARAVSSAKKSVPAGKAASAKKTAKKAASSKKATSSNKAAPVKKAAKKAASSKKVAKKASRPTKAASSKKAADKAASAGKKATPRETSEVQRSPFKASFLKSQHELLLKERATYLHQAEMLQAEAESLVADFVSGDVQFDEESGEGDTISIERERDLTLSAQAREAVSEIDHALAKFDLGTYGICETSGLPIPEERLEAIPWARQRVEYKVAGLGRR